MKLKQIQIQGFKSFASRTVLNFTDNITLVVGPNGCGKSNIVDSIRWVMGEQSARHLRGENMADVIFHGAEDASGVGMAEVALSFDNSAGTAPGEYSKFTEIQISRRLFSNGDSEYYINRTPCRLKDITDLFLGSGAGTRAYSIIEQGRIESIITMKPEQRRVLIEEAAGVSKYRSRKIEAERKMDSTRQNLLRLRDIIAELTRQMNSLNRQAKKAERYKVAREDLRQVELELAALKAHEITTERDQVAAALTELKDREVQLTAELETAQAKLETKKADVTGVETELNDLRARIVEASRAVEKEENALAFLNQEKKSLDQNLARIESDQRELSSRAESIGREIADLGAELGRIEAESAHEQEALGQVEREKTAKEQEFRETLDASQALDKKAAVTRASLEKIKERIEWAGRRAQELERTRNDAQAKLAELNSDLETKARTNISYNEKLYQLRKELTELKETIVAREGRLAEARTKRAVVADRLAGLEKNLQRLSSRLESLRDMERNFEGYQRGVKSIMERKRQREAQGQNGIYGLITDSIQVEPDYELALEAVLGERLQSIVVKDRSQGLDNIKYLQEQNAGKSSFVPLEAGVSPVIEVPPLLREMGAELLFDKVTVAENYRPMVQAMIGPALVVDDLDAAAQIRHRLDATNPLVTRDGVLYDECGVIMGGSKDSYGGFLAKKREMEELAEQLETIGADRDQARAELEALDHEIKENHRLWEEMRDRLHRREIDRNNLDKDLRQGTEAYNNIKEALRKLEQEEIKTAEAAHTLEAETRENTAQVESQAREMETFEDQQAQMRIKQNQLRAEREAVNERYTGVQVQVAALREKLEAQRRHYERLTRGREEVLAGNQRRESETAEINERLVSLARELEEVEQRRGQAVVVAKGLSDRMGEKNAAYEAVGQEIRGRESRIKNLYRDRDELKTRLMDAELALSQLKMKWEALEENVRDKFACELAEVLGSLPAPDGECDLHEEKRRLREELKEKIDRMGEVNLTAIEEFEEISQRHSFLSNQEADLIQALENLELAIAKINSAYRRAFKKTFDEVNLKFQEIFPRLFNGGKAALELTNVEDILDTGVEIMAQPPGKKMNSIALLSGGEKALTASGLILALFQVRPSPFCILDEVDAALDDVNVVRFNEMVRELADNSQLIVITHNRKTMEIADAIYGVTMEQKGVSKIVSVRFKQVSPNGGDHAAAANS